MAEELQFRHESYGKTTGWSGEHYRKKIEGGGALNKSPSEESEKSDDSFSLAGLLLGKEKKSSFCSLE